MLSKDGKQCKRFDLDDWGDFTRGWYGNQVLIRVWGFLQKRNVAVLRGQEGREAQRGFCHECRSTVVKHLKQGTESCGQELSGQEERMV